MTTLFQTKMSRFATCGQINLWCKQAITGVIENTEHIPDDALTFLSTGNLYQDENNEVPTRVSHVQQIYPGKPWQVEEKHKITENLKLLSGGSRGILSE